MSEFDARIAAAYKQLSGKKLGLWIDDHRNTVDRSYVSKLVAMGFESAVVMVDAASSAWDPQWSFDNLKTLSDTLAGLGVDMSVTVWPWPNPPWMNSAFKWLREMLESGVKVHAIECDVEGNWRGKNVRGFAQQDGRTPLDLAGDALVEHLQALKKDFGVGIEATTFTEHTENGRAADVVPFMDRVNVQAYSIRKRPDGTLIDWDHTYGPGRMQRFTLDRTMLVPGVRDGKVKVGVGLAAWSQTWPDHTAEEAILVALERALKYNNVDTILWWSSKWIVGGMTRNGTSPLRDFLLKAKSL